jgi:hypothetical protein
MRVREHVSQNIYIEHEENPFSGGAQEYMNVQNSREFKEALKAPKDTYVYQEAKRIVDTYHAYLDHNREAKSNTDKLKNSLDQIGGTRSGGKLLDELKECGKKGKTITVRTVTQGNFAFPILSKEQANERGLTDNESQAAIVIATSMASYKGKTAGQGANAVVLWSTNHEQDMHHICLTKETGDSRMTTAALANQLIHADRIMKGKHSAGDPSNSPASMRQQLKAIGLERAGNPLKKPPTENAIRKELGIPARSSYGGYFESNHSSLESLAFRRGVDDDEP